MTFFLLALSSSLLGAAETAPAAATQDPNLTAAERSTLESAMDESLRVLPELVRGDWQRASTELHTRTRA